MSAHRPGWERARRDAHRFLWLRRIGGFSLVISQTFDDRYSAEAAGKTLPAAFDSFEAAEAAAIAALRQWCTATLNVIRNHYPGRVRGPYRHKSTPSGEPHV